jgi:GNAT superfamily N-acetyltransferase
MRLLENSEATDFQPRLDAWLRPGAAVTSANEAPLLLGPNARSKRVVAEVAGEAVSHAALYVHQVHVHGCPLSVGVIGAVATDPRWRQQGLAGQVLAEIEGLARAENLDLLALWATDTGLYEQAGFVRSGHEWIAAWQNDDLHGPYRVRALEANDLPALMSIHAREAVHTQRSLADWQALVRIPAMTGCVAVDGALAVQAYAFCGKGIDLENCIHEWAGVAGALPALASYTRASLGVPEIYIMGGQHQASVLQVLQPHTVALRQGALGMLRLLRPAAVAERFRLTGILATLEAQPDCESLERDAAEHVPPEVRLFGDDQHAGLIALHLSGLDSM